LLASTVLAKQIEAGACAAALLRRHRLGGLSRQLSGAGSRRVLLGNWLALIAPAGSGVRLKIVPGLALLAALHGGHLCMADPHAMLGLLVLSDL